MFNEATFWEILLPSLFNIDDYVEKIYENNADQDGNSIRGLANLSEKTLSR